QRRSVSWLGPPSHHMNSRILDTFLPSQCQFLAQTKRSDCELALASPESHARPDFRPAKPVLGIGQNELTGQGLSLSFQLRPGIVLEVEWLAADQLVAGDGRADKLFDVFDDEVGAGEMTDVRPALGVVHGVGQVAHEDDMLAVAGHLPEAER